jgi:hypothetical protein
MPTPWDAGLDELALDEQPSRSQSSLEAFARLANFLALRGVDPEHINTAAALRLRASGLLGLREAEGVARGVPGPLQSIALLTAGKQSQAAGQYLTFAIAPAALLSAHMARRAYDEARRVFATSQAPEPVPTEAELKSLEAWLESDMSSAVSATVAASDLGWWGEPTSDLTPIV